MPRFHPRISILNALLVTTIVGMVIVIVQLWREMDRWHTEVRELRDEVGKLWIDDPHKASAIRLLSLDESTWKYRIYVPPGRRYGLVLSVNDVPQRGLPSIWRPPARTGRWERSILPNGHYVFLCEGEHVITIGTARTEGGVRCLGMELYDVSTGLRQKTSSVEVDAKHWPRLDMGGFEEGVGRTTRIIDGEDELVLMRYRVPNGGTPLGQLMDGFLLWLEPIHGDRDGDPSAAADSIKGD